MLNLRSPVQESMLLRDAAVRTRQDSEHQRLSFLVARLAGEAYVRVARELLRRDQQNRVFIKPLMVAAGPMKEHTATFLARR